MGYAGYKVGQNRKHQPKIKYVCSCTHNYNEHLENGKGSCNVATVTFRNNKVQYRAQCPCGFYLGPKPDPSPEDILNLFNKDNERDTKSNN